jgi:hypothetical protein
MVEPAGGGEQSPDSTTIGAVATYIGAAAAAGAAGVHLAMVPSHADSSQVEGIGFAGAGWVGVVIAAALLLRPRRSAVVLAAGAHLALIGLWAWSRTAGLPVGSHAGQSERVGGIDVFTVVLEAVVVLAAMVVLSGWSAKVIAGAMHALTGVAVAGVLGGATVALVAPSARNHATHARGGTVVDGESAAPSAESRTVGVPLIGGVPVTPESVGIAGGHAHGGIPASAEAWSDISGGSQGLGANGVVPVVPDAAGVAGGHGHGGVAVASAAVDLSTRCDLGFNPVSYWDEMLTVHGGVARPVVGSAELDSVIRETVREGAESKGASVVVALGKASDATYTSWINWLPTYVGASHAAGAASGAPDDNGGHGGHLGPQAWTPMTDQAECDQLTSELARAKAVAMKYPTPTDAEAAGWVKVTGYVPGIAAHYMRFSYVDGTFDIDEPEMLLYDGTGPDASMVGLSYFLIHDSSVEPTQGFTGPNDHFHRHDGLCVSGEGVIGDSSTPKEECEARGGRKAAGLNGWMNHVWIVPGCESPWGLFSGASPTLERTLGDKSGTDGGGCAGSAVLDRFDLTPGTADTVDPALTGKSS